VPVPEIVGKKKKKKEEKEGSGLLFSTERRGGGKKKKKERLVSVSKGKGGQRGGDGGLNPLKTGGKKPHQEKPGLGKGGKGKEKKGKAAVNALMEKEGREEKEKNPKKAKDPLRKGRKGGTWPCLKEKNVDEEKSQRKVSKKKKGRERGGKKVFLMARKGEGGEVSGPAGGLGEVEKKTKKKRKSFEVPGQGGGKTAFSFLGHVFFCRYI